jgi:hypothetical protein
MPVPYHGYITDVCSGIDFQVGLLWQARERSRKRPLKKIKDRTGQPSIPAKTKDATTPEASASILYGKNAAIP